MNLTTWFSERLRLSADGLAWAIEQVPAERLYARPPAGLGDWSVARHLFHMYFYERTFAYPAMRPWFDQSLSPITGPSEEFAWAGGQPLADSLENFRAVRQEKIALLEDLEEATWAEKRDSYWGPVTLQWVVTKTYQHTAEHTSEILRIALFWDHI